jgi:hypothetical protein
VAHFPYQREKSCAFESIVKCNRYDDGVIFCGMRANDLVSRLGVEGATVNLAGQVRLGDACWIQLFSDVIYLSRLFCLLLSFFLFLLVCFPFFLNVVS